MLTAIIVAGGSSRRMGFDKTFALLRGRPVIVHTMAAFEAASRVDEIVIVGRADRLAEVRDAVKKSGFEKVKHVVAGGAHRQDSVRAGLECVAADSNYVGVHDAARPLVKPAQIQQVLNAALAHRAAALAAPISDTLKRADEQHFICGSIEREHVYAMQTPQIFAREILVDAYDAIAKQNLSVTDEASALQHLGHKVQLVPNHSLNLKITFPEDLALAEMALG